MQFRGLTRAVCLFLILVVEVPAEVQELPPHAHVGVHPLRAEGPGRLLPAAHRKRLRVPHLHRVSQQHRALTSHKAAAHRNKHTRTIKHAATWFPDIKVPDVLPEVSVPKVGMPNVLDKRPQPINSLAEYCAPHADSKHEDGFHLHQYVEGNWKDYDQWFKAEIVKDNSDGTYDLVYHDGMEEFGVPEERIRILNGGSAPHLNAAKSDPVCKVSNVIMDLQKKVAGAHEEIGKYLTMSHDSEVKGLKPGPPKFKTKTELEADQKAAAKTAVAKKGAAGSGSSDGQATVEGAAAAGKGLFEKYGDEDAVAGAVDPDGDGQVSKAELKRVLTQEVGVSPEKADQLADDVWDKNAAGGDGPIALDDIQQLVRRAAEKDAADTAAEAEGAQSNGEGEGEGEGAGEGAGEGTGEAAGAAAVTGGAGQVESDADEERSPEELAAMKKECASRDKELLDRYEALGTFRDKVEEMKNLWAADKQDESSPLPSSPEEMGEEIKKLKQKILDRAAKLEDLLASEKEAESQADASIADVAEQSSKLLDDMEADGNAIDVLVKQLADQSGALKLAGELDPELRVNVDRVLKAATKMSSSMLNIASKENQMEHDAVGDGDGLQDQTKVTVMHQQLDAQLKDLDSDMREMRQDTDAFEEKVVPAGKKWWRYRWEYSMVEALLMALLCLLAFLWEGLHWWMKGWIIRASERSPLFIKEYQASSLYASWSRFMFGEMFVMLLVVLSIWILNRSGLFEIIIRIQYQITDQAHLPNDAKTYNGLSYEIAMQMAVALMLFFALCLGVVRAATTNERDVRILEGKSSLAEGSASPADSQAAQNSMIGTFAKDAGEFRHLKRCFFHHMKQYPRIDRMLQAEGKNDFLLWFFISKRVKFGVEMVFMIRPITWILLFITFVLFAFVHRFEHTSFSTVIFIFGTILIGLFVLMYCIVRREAALIKEHSEVMSKKNLDEVVQSPGERARPKASGTWDLQTILAITIQFPLFFLCYGAARVLLSPAMWVYFFNWTLAVFFLLIFMLTLFHLVVAPNIVTYFIAMSFPPHTHEPTDELLVAQTVDERKKIELRKQLVSHSERSQSGSLYGQE